MPVDPQIQALLDFVASKNLPPHYLLTPPEARAAMEKSRAIFRPPEPVPLPRIEELSIPGPAGALPARLYGAEARGAGAPPIVLYFHGGGWVTGSLDTHDDLCRRLAKRSGCLVVSLDYRLAPEHKFPAAVDDACAATRWIAQHGRELGGDPMRLAVAGDSAGGNLAAAVALLARDQGGPALRQQVLIYPATTHDFTLPSVSAYGEGFLLTAQGMAWFWDHYLPSPADREDFRASPLRAKSLAGLPSALVLTAEYDVLRDEGELYAERLKREGVPTRLVRHAGMIHGFITMSVVARTLQIVDELGQAIQAGLG
jgi:acetyl esterase